MSVSHAPPQAWTGREDTEDGSDARRVHHLAGDAGRNALIGFACEAGVQRNQGRVGAKQGPSALRAALASLAAPQQAETFVDLGDIVVDGDDLESGQELLGERVAEGLAVHDRVVVIGGGHETAFGTYLGIAQSFPNERVGIVNLDAHLDIRNVGDAGPSSGTPFNQIRQLDPKGFDYLCLGVAEEANTVALLDRGTDWGVRFVDDHALLADRSAADQAILELAQRCDLLYLTIDIDVMPHYQAPGVSAPAARGLDFRIIEHLVNTVMNAARDHARLPIADIVELSPPNDRDNMTAKTAAYLARRLLFQR